MRNPYKKVIGVILSVAIAGGGIAVWKGNSGGGGGSAPAGVANVWVDTNGGTCTRSSTAIAYNDAAACSTPAAAWTAMNAGDTTRIANGDYTTGCTLSGSKASETFFIGNNSSTRFACHIVSQQNMTLQDMTVQEFSTGATNAKLLNVNITCSDSAPFTLYAPANLCSAAIHVTHSTFSFINGSVGPSYDASDCGGGGPFSAIGASTQPTGITFTNIEWHTARNTSCTSQHSEVLRIDGGDNITFDRNYFHCGGTTGLLFISNNGNQGVSGGQSDNLTIKNTLFRDTGGCAASGGGGTTAIGVNYDATCVPAAPTNLKIINVIAHGAISFDSGCASYPGSVIANTVWRGANPCPGGIATFANNAPYQPNTGGTTDRCGGDAGQIGVGTQSNNDASPSAWFTCSTGCAAAGPSTHTLAASSPLINTGTNTQNPGSDYLGIITRPCGGTIDIGIYESGCVVANLWVDTNGGTCTRSASLVAYSDAAACSSFDAAYQAASDSGGDLIFVKGGTYPSQLLNPDTGKTGPAYTTIQEATGETVIVGTSGDTVNCVGFDGSDYVTLRGIATIYTTQTALSIGTTTNNHQCTISVGRNNTHHVNIDQVDSGIVWIGADNVNVTNSDLGPSVDQNVKIERAETTGPANIVFDGNTIHDVIRGVDHIECVALWGGHGVTFNNNTLNNCEVFHIWVVGEIDDVGADALTDINLTNNIFTQTNTLIPISSVVKVGDHKGEVHVEITGNDVNVDAVLLTQGYEDTGDGEIFVTDNTVTENIQNGSGSPCMDNLDFDQAGAHYICDNNVIG